MQDSKDDLFGVHDCGPINATRLNRTLTVCGLKIFSRIKKRRIGCAYLLPFGIVLKAGQRVLLAEAHTIQCIHANTSVPVPKIYCAFTRENTGVTYIVQQKIKGHMIGTDWNKRDEESKCRLLAHLRTMIEEIRTFEPPPGVGVQNICGGPMRDIRITMSSPFGPFPNVDDFHKWLRYDWKETKPLSVEEAERQDDQSLNSTARKAYAMHMSRSSWPLKFTHADLNWGNIFVQGDEVTGIIDWESSGWYPYYREWARARIDTEGGHVQQEYAGKWLQPFVVEENGEFARSVCLEH